MNSKNAYRSFQIIFDGPEFADLKAAGAAVQRPLWASTSTKNPAYRDVMYVESLIGPHTVNTMPHEFHQDNHPPHNSRKKTASFAIQ